MPSHPLRCCRREIQISPLSLVSLQNRWFCIFPHLVWLIFGFERAEVVKRPCPSDGDGDVLMDPLMVDWFKLIRKKQMFVRKASELVYL